MKLILFIITMLLIQSSWGNKYMEIEGLFENELTKRNVSFTKMEEGVYEVETSESKITISIHNMRLNYLRDKDSEIINRFVDNILQIIPDLPSWDILKSFIYPSLEPSDYEGLNELVHKKLTDKTVIILTYYNSENNQIRFLDETDLKELSIDVNQVWEQAFLNLDKIMDETKVDFTDIDGQMLGMLEAHEPYKASLILSTKLKDKVSKQIGWPIYAVSPARDFVYLFSKEGGLMNKVGNVVVREYQNSGYPISTEVWELSDSKQIAIGAYPSE